MKKIFCITMILIIILISSTAFASTTEVSGTCTLVLDDEGILTISPTDGKIGTLALFTSNDPQVLFSEHNKVKKVIINKGVKADEDCNQLFAYFTLCTEMDLKNLDTSNVVDMSSMFLNCSSLEKLDLSTFNTSNVTNMMGMFQNCSSLEKIDLSTFDTSNITYMTGMFCGCSKLKSLDLSNFDTSNVELMDDMFSQCVAN